MLLYIIPIIVGLLPWIFEKIPTRTRILISISCIFICVIIYIKQPQENDSSVEDSSGISSPLRDGSTPDDEGRGLVKGDISPISELESMEDSIAAAIKEASEVFLPNGEYILARNVILAGLEQHPNNSELLKSLDYYNSFEPIRLSDMNELMAEGGEITTYGTKKTDNLGTVYEWGDYVLADYNMGFLVSSDRKTVSETYMIDGKYTNFYGTIVLDGYYKNTDLIGLIRVIGDGEELFEQDGITKGFLPQDFNINITGIKQLVIEFEGYDRFKCLIVNSYLVNYYTGFSSSINE